MIATAEPIDTHAERRGGLLLHLRPGVSADAVIEALRAPGVVLKRSEKSVTRRVGEWVIKESRLQGGLGPVKRTVLRRRYRRAWTAACHLAEHGILVPAPVAFVEKRRLGVVIGNVLVCEYLDGLPTVEEFAGQLKARGASTKAVREFLRRMAQAINALIAAGAYHADLSGKNILTRDGTDFYFIDLDAVMLTRTYTDTYRHRNHVQLYDSFCDLFDEVVLKGFLAEMALPGCNLDAWTESVRAAQRRRRARTEAIWRKQGKL